MDKLVIETEMNRQKGATDTEQASSFGSEQRLQPQSDKEGEQRSKMDVGPCLNRCQGRVLIGQKCRFRSSLLLIQLHSLRLLSTRISSHFLTTRPCYRVVVHLLLSVTGSLFADERPFLVDNLLPALGLPRLYVESSIKLLPLFTCCRPTFSDPYFAGRLFLTYQ
jgi:hypothetical protein